MKFPWVAGAGALFFAAGCVEIPPPFCPEEDNDFDGDGWTCRSGDCDDGNPAINPGVRDDPDDFIDQDCVGGALQPDDVYAGIEVVAASDDYQVTTATAVAHVRHGPTPDLLAWGLRSLASKTSAGQLLFEGEPSGLERYAGVGLYPLYSGHTAGSSVLEADLSPAYVAFTISWQASFDDEAAGGTTVYAFFPDGRIHRHEISSPDTGGFDHATEGLYYSTFVSLDSSLFTEIDWTGNNIPVIPGPVLEPGLGMCAFDRDDERMVAIAWRDTDGRGPRITLGPEATPRLAMEYDWVRNMPTVAPGVYQSSSEILIGGPSDDTDAPCAAIDPLLEEPPGLVVDNGSPDDDDDGYFEELGHYALIADGDHVDFELDGGSIPDGMVVRVSMAAPIGVTVWGNGERLVADRDYLIDIQDDAVGDDESVTIYLRGSFEEGHAFRIANHDGQLAP